ncbi:Zinc finger, C2H2 type family protein [Trichuris trichiura]|uniref:Zinc finger, C2H2 type family protein n=1 Tax=Trichuris trichiura TaxID=36087 RepID=A0A077Z0H2_TRITR|nr:Zinc finger, C2H2 type family protein [Trichuris trichiura]
MNGHATPTSRLQRSTKSGCDGFSIDALLERFTSPHAQAPIGSNPTIPWPFWPCISPYRTPALMRFQPMPVVPPSAFLNGLPRMLNPSLPAFPLPPCTMWSPFCATTSGQEKTTKEAADHVSKSITVKKYKCDVCEKAFSRSNTLLTHKFSLAFKDSRHFACIYLCFSLQRIHTGEKPFKCDSCGRAFRQPGNLTRHRLTHTTVKPYACDQCGRAFNRASNLHTHMRTHCHFRPFACVHCGKGFNHKVDLKLHNFAHAASCV